MSVVCEAESGASHNIEYIGAFAWTSQPQELG